MAKRRPVGHERLEHGRVVRKVAEPNVWMYRSRAVWAAAHGPVPAGYIIHHINEDSVDDRLDNLQCMTRGEHTRHHIRWGSPRRNIETAAYPDSESLRAWRSATSCELMEG